MSVISVVKKLNAILLPQDKVKMGVLFVLMVFGTIAELLGIGTLMAFVSLLTKPDSVFAHEKLQPLLTTLSIDSEKELLIWSAGLLMVVFVLKNLYLLGFKFIQTRFVYKWYVAISLRLFATYMHVPYSFYLMKNTADIIRNMSSEVLYLTTKVVMPLLKIGLEVVMATAILIALFCFNPIITGIVFVFLGGMGVLFLKLIRENMKRHGAKAQCERANLVKIIQEGIGGYKSVLIMRRQDFFLKRLDESITRLAKAQTFQQVAKQSLVPIAEVFSVIGLLLITLVLLLQGQTLTMILPMLALFVFSLRRLQPAVSVIISEYNSLRYFAHVVDPVYEDLVESEHRQKTEKDSHESTHPMTFSEAIVLEHVGFRYGSNVKPVLQDISFRIQKGSAVGLLGATGSGKTTLIDILLGLLEPEEGRITIDGVDMRTHKQAWQARLGYVPQSIFLSDDTIRSNIAFGLQGNDINEEQLRRAIAVAQLKDFIDSLPHGADTVIGERGVRLSGGQRQRIGIARALYHNPEVLIMDEATSSLDSITEKEVIRAIETIKEDRTVIIIAHRLTTVKKCDALHIIKDGAVVASGTYDELLAQNKDFQSFVEASEDTR